MPNLAKNSSRYVDLFSQPKFVCPRAVFYGASDGEIRFHLTFLVSDLRGVGLWSDFEILAVKFKKIYVSTRFGVGNSTLKSETRYHVAIISKKCFKHWSK